MTTLYNLFERIYVSCFFSTNFGATFDACWGTLEISVFGNSGSAANHTWFRLSSRLSFSLLWLWLGTLQTSYWNSNHYLLYHQLPSWSLYTPIAFTLTSITKKVLMPYGPYLPFSFGSSLPPVYYWSLSFWNDPGIILIIFW